MILLLRQSQHGCTEFAAAMDDRTGILPGFPAVAGKPVHVAFDGGRLTSDAGILLLAAIEQRLGIADRLANCIEDPRAPERVRHGLSEMIRYRALLIAAGYPDGTDCDALKSDPAFKMAVGRLPESGADLCSQPTISRLENLPGPVALKRMMAAMVELFCDSFEEVPRRILLSPGRRQRKVRLQLVGPRSDFRASWPSFACSSLIGMRLSDTDFAFGIRRVRICRFQASRQERPAQPKHLSGLSRNARQ